MKKIRILVAVLSLVPMMVAAQAGSGYVFTDLGAFSRVAAINNAGQVLGYSYTADVTEVHATIWSGTSTTDLGTLGGTYSSVFGINSAGLAIGSSYTTGNAEVHATRWNGTTATDLGTLGGSDRFGRAINNAGQMVGQSNMTGNTADHATLWNSTSAIDLGTLGGTYSDAYAINDSGQVVGYSSSGGFAPNRATLWSGSSIIDLNDLLDPAMVSAGWLLFEAYGINDSGSIVGYAENSLTGNGHAFELSAIREPESYALMPAGLGIVGAAVRRRKLNC